MGVQLQGELRNKVEELEKYRELALHQVERIQRCINTISQHRLLPVEGDSILEEGIALSATTSAILSDISVCISLLNEQVCLVPPSLKFVRNMGN